MMGGTTTLCELSFLIHSFPIKLSSGSSDLCVIVLCKLCYCEPSDLFRIINKRSPENKEHPRTSLIKNNPEVHGPGSSDPTLGFGDLGRQIFGLQPFMNCIIFFTCNFVSLKSSKRISSVSWTKMLPSIRSLTKKVTTSSERPMNLRHLETSSTDRADRSGGGCHGAGSSTSPLGTPGV